MTSKLKYNRGFTLMDLLGVLAILSIILLIVVPSISSSVEKANREVCYSNIIELERHYEMHLTLDDIEHSETLFFFNSLESLMKQYVQKME
ncbi:prepilin-type N-terminal cleavage/methylation domain-containing protein [Ornithinibacillus salinisoli]|uniref:Prepilin-type N-terminal cleavage/methylation domain-containing protein n=1 Tax=Ornithinibacillus salinisoli TaxID=1848459 RepID=A0ABW4VZP9_9BACI